MKHAFLFLLVACASEPATEPTTPTESEGTVGTEATPSGDESPEAALLGAWQHDHDQSADGVDVFVRGDLELPPARFRQRWTFEAGGVLRASTLAANDAHGEGEGRWRLEGDRLVVEMPGEAPQVWVIVGVGETLRVRRAE
ncbi:MAG: hypothetical protein MUE69_17145 [Myxococcota bacterium]|nr:hypothetical protein [Myxococcota bacterium]